MMSEFFLIIFAGLLTEKFTGQFKWIERIANTLRNSLSNALANAFFDSLGGDIKCIVIKFIAPIADES